MKYLAALLLVVSSAAHAETEKLAMPCASDEGVCFYWWPKLPNVTGWHHDREHSLLYSSNALAPDGFTFANAETVMYAKALFKPRLPETKSLQQLIAEDAVEFARNTPGVTIAEVSGLKTSDGAILKSYTFFPTSQGNWERVSYGEEGEFYLVFTLSSRTKAGYERAMTTYENLLRDYKEKL